MVSKRSSGFAPKAGVVISTLALLASYLIGCSRETTSDRNRRLTVLAAASLTEAMRAVADAFENEHGSRVDVATGPSNALANQVLQGARADVLVTANSDWIEALWRESLIQSSKPLLTNHLALIVPQGNPARISNVDDLLAEHVQRVAIAGDRVPAGIYAKQALEAYGLWDQLVASSRLLRGASVRSALVFVELGEAEAGIVYVTDANQSQQTETILVFHGEDALPEIVYSVGLLRSDGSEPDKLAEQFFAFLDTARAQEIFRVHGFGSKERIGEQTSQFLRRSCARRPIFVMCTTADFRHQPQRDSVRFKPLPSSRIRIERANRRAGLPIPPSKLCTTADLRHVHNSRFSSSAATR